MAKSETILGRKASRKAFHWAGRNQRRIGLWSKEGDHYGKE